MIEFRVLGSVDLADRAAGNDFRELLAQPKRVALLAYLALKSAHGFQRRDSLLPLFWPDSNEVRARHALSQALYVLRQALGGVICTRGTAEVGVDAEMLCCDSVVFESALTRGERANALEVYRGDLLEGFYLSGCPEFERWLEEERARLRERALEAARSLAAECEAGGEEVGAVYWARRAVSLSRHDEQPLRHLLTLLLRLGDRAAALKEYTAFRDRLVGELQLEPSPDLETLFERIRSEPAGPGPRPDVSVAESRPAEPLPARPFPAAGRTGRFWRTRSVALLAASLVLALTALSLGVFRDRWIASGKLDLDPRRVVVAEFANETGDAGLDKLGHMVEDWLARGLAEMSLLEVIPAGAAGELDLEGDGASRATGVLALAEAAGAGLAVWGGYYTHNDSAVIQVHLSDAGSRSILTSLEPIATLVDEPREALDTLSRRTMAAVATFVDARLSRWVKYASKPPTFEAYQEFITGLDLHTARRASDVAVAHYLRAAALDSSFTLPLLWALFIADQETTDSILGKLLGSRERLPPLERHLLDYHYAYVKRCDRPAVYRAIRRVVELAPESEFLYNAGVAALEVGRPREALVYLHRADPHRGWLRDWDQYWSRLADAYHHAGEHRRALAVLHVEQRRRGDRYAFLGSEARELAALGRTTELEQLLDGRLGQPSEPGEVFSVGLFLLNAANELAAHGHGPEAAGFRRRGLEWYDDGTAGELESRDRIAVALALATLGRAQEARAIVEENWGHLAATNHPYILGLLGMFAAMEGEREDALRYEGRLATVDQVCSVNQQRTAGWAFAWRARIAGWMGEPERALALLRQAFTRGYRFYGELHSDVGFEPLWDHPGFKELERPKG